MIIVDRKRRASALIVLALLASLLTVVSPRIANAAESVPNLQWPAISVGYRDMPLVESPVGSTSPFQPTPSGSEELQVKASQPAGFSLS